MPFYCLRVCIMAYNRIEYDFYIITFINEIIFMITYFISLYSLSYLFIEHFTSVGSFSNLIIDYLHDCSLITPKITSISITATKIANRE